MYNKKKLIGKKIKNYKLAISNFTRGMNTEVAETLLPHSYAYATYNFGIKRGVLETGMGFCDLKLPQSVNILEERKILIPEEVTAFEKLYFFPSFRGGDWIKTNMILAFSAGKLYWVKTESLFGEMIVEDGFIYEAVPVGTYYNIDGKDVMIFTSPKDSMKIMNALTGQTEHQDAPKIISMCKHYERIFAIEHGRQNKIVFSANLNPANWNISADEAGYIELFDERGKLLKIVSFNDYVYVFREMGITRISAYGNQSEFNVTQMYLTSDKIYGNSVAVCGDRIIFLAKSGLYTFDGYSTKKLGLGIESLFNKEDNSNACAAYANGKYYLAARLDFDDGEKIGAESSTTGYINNALIEYDFKTGDINILRGVDIKDLCYAESDIVSKLVAIFNGENSARVGELTFDGKVFDVPTVKVWKSSRSDMGFPGKIKILRSVSVYSEFPCSLKIKTDAESKTYSFSGGKTTRIVRPKIRGEMVEFEIRSNDALSMINPPEIVFGVEQ